MEPASTKRFRFRLSLKGLLGATTFLAVVLGGLRVSNLHLIEKGMVITWALITVIGITLAPARFLRLILTSFLCGAVGGCLPAALVWYANYGRARISWIEDCGYPILALTLVGAIAGTAVGCAAWLCARPRRIVVAAAACAIVALTDYGWRSLAYWHPLRTVQFEPLPQTFALSSDGELLASGGETVQTWDTTTGRLRSVQFGKPEFEHATSYNRLRFLAGDRRYLVAGRWGQDALHVFDRENGHEVAAVPIPVIAIRFCRFVDGGTLAVGWNDAGHEKIDIGDVRHWGGKETVYDSEGLNYFATSDDLTTVASRGGEVIEITRAANPAHSGWFSQRGGKVFRSSYRRMGAGLLVTTACWN